MHIIDMKALTKVYGKARGINDVNLTINKGEFFGFIGPNGAGKSTTIKLLLNLLYPTSGSAEIFDMDTITHSSEIKKSLGYVPSEVRYYPNLTGGELMKTTLDFHNNKNQGAIDVLCEKLDIDKNKKIGELSLGNKKKIAIACAIIHEPKLIILDEPTSGLDPLIQKKLFEILKEQNKNGATIFLSSHNLSEVQAHCTKVALIKDGKIIKVQDLSKEHSCMKIVTVTAENLQKSTFEEMGIAVLSSENNTVKLSYKGEIDRLINIIASLKPTDLTIENSSLEDEFLAYYEEDKQNEHI